MFFKIDSGLFQFDFTDHHAILGVPVDADFNEIRKRYLKIVRRLHPDSCPAVSEVDKQQASQLLSKLINPAYEKFAHESSRAEYVVLLKEMGKRLVQEATAELSSELSKQLAETNNIERVYKTSLYKLSEKQYESFDHVLQIIGQISELNLVYLTRKGGIIQAPPPPVSGERTVASPPPPPQQQESVVEQYFRRAQALIAKNNFTQARVELQDALKLEPNNSRCHSLMGIIYLKQNQITMAKIHFERALKLNPQDKVALEGKSQLDQLGQKSSGQTTTAPKPTSGKPSQSGGSGMFGGLFGRKKN